MIRLWASRQRARTLPGSFINRSLTQASMRTSPYRARRCAIIGRSQASLSPTSPALDGLNADSRHARPPACDTSARILLHSPLPFRSARGISSYALTNSQHRPDCELPRLTLGCSAPTPETTLIRSLSRPGPHILAPRRAIRRPRPTPSNLDRDVSS